MSQPSDKKPGRGITDEESARLVADLVVGTNFRRRDNLLQAIMILLVVAIGAGIGALVERNPATGALDGGLLGVPVGLILSGAGIMIYRAVRHMDGKHD